MSEHISDNPEVQAHYERLRSEGQSHNFAEMVALRKCAGHKVQDGHDSFMQGKKNNEDLEHMTPCLRDKLLENVTKAGVSIRGKTYCSGLARFPNDPQAFVSGPDEIKAACKDRGWDCAGAVNHRSAESKQPKEPANITRAKRTVALQKKLLANKLIEAF